MNSHATKDALISELARSFKDLARFFRLIGPRGDGCWIWTGAKLKGYGTFKFKGKHLAATRISWFLAGYDALQPGDKVCHTCDNPPCVNPTHLFAGSNSDNMKDSVRKGRTIAPGVTKAAKTTHCPKGHEYDFGNTYWHKGHRYCRACDRARKH